MSREHLEQQVAAVSAALQQSLTLLIRGAEPGRLDAVMSYGDREAVCAILAQALGPPAKPFGAQATFDAPTAKLVKTIGGVQKQQCLYLKPDGPQHVLYAALWPWESDPEKMSVRLGIHERSA